MIHAFAVEPELAATWGERAEYRFYVRSFGIGTPRALFEIPKFSKWRRAVLMAAERSGQNDMDRKRVEAMIRVLEQARYKRKDIPDHGTVGWLERAEREHARHPFEAILALTNPRESPAVVAGDSEAVERHPRWQLPNDKTPDRKAKQLAEAVSGMLGCCAHVVLIDPHFAPEMARHRKTLVAIVRRLVEARPDSPELIEVYCRAKHDLGFFEEASSELAAQLPSGVTVRFVRLSQIPGQQALHNRYILTNLGGVLFGTGLDEGQQGQTEDVLLLGKDTFEKRWAQYVGSTRAFDVVDRPREVVGTWESAEG